MKRFLLICILLITAGSLVAQTPTVADLTITSGSNIKWYAASAGGSALTTSTVLVNGTTYYASQTVNGVESATRLAVIATVAPCITAPSITTNSVSNIGSTTATFNGNITAINGANVTTRGFKYSTTSGFDPATTGTNISESGPFGTGAFSLSPSGLVTVTTYYVRAYATNSAGTTYGTQVSFNTLIQTDFNYTGGQQTFIVPAGITTITLEAWGAQGGQGWINGSLGSGMGGYGGYAQGTLSVTEGQTIYLFVGGQGGSTSSIGTGGYNGGGTSQDNDGDYDDAGGGGGGASDIRVSGVNLSNRVLVAGGGGGGGCSSGNGGAGGGTSGLQGLGSTGGLPGTQVSGYTLGNGQSAVTSDSTGGGVVGSGGGGYYGGYRGGTDYSSGGGGGSSYIGGVTSGSTTAGQRSGNGRILISY